MDGEACIFRVFFPISPLDEGNGVFGTSDLGNNHLTLLQSPPGLNGILSEKKLKSDEFEKVVKELSKSLEKYMFFGWFNQITVKKEVEREIRKFVRGMKGKYNLSLDEMNGLHEKLLESVKNYGTA